MSRTRHHHTKAIVLKSFPHGEASRTILLFTEELGLIYARAQGVRKSAAKLRAHLSEHSLARVSLVQGKEVWRLIGAERVSPLQERGTSSRLLRARLSSLLERFVTGVGEQPELFAECDQLWRFLEQDLSQNERDYFEVVAVLRVMHVLGYIGGSGMFESLVPPVPLSRESLPAIGPVRAQAIAAINDSFAHSHL